MSRVLPSTLMVRTIRSPMSTLLRSTFAPTLTARASPTAPSAQNRVANRPKRRALPVIAALRVAMPQASLDRAAQFLFVVIECVQEAHGLLRRHALWQGE